VPTVRAMSSPTFAISLVKQAPGRVTLRVRSLNSSGLNDYASSPMFALMSLAEARRKAAELAKRKASGAAHALEQESKAWPSDFRNSFDFWNYQLPVYIKDTQRAQKRTLAGDLSDKQREKIATIERTIKDRAKQEDELCKILPHTFIEVNLADDRWRKGLETGWIWETTAYDPDRPEDPPRGKVKPGVFGTDVIYKSKKLDAGWAKKTTDVSRSVFRNAKVLDGATNLLMRGGAFQEATFTPGITFTRCDFRFTAFSDSTLRGVGFEDCNLDGCDFIRCDLREVAIRGGSMQGARIIKGQVTNATGLPKKG
jgi:hypothetical protein